MWLPINVSLPIQICSAGKLGPHTARAGSSRLHICYGQQRFIYSSHGPRKKCKILINGSREQTQRDQPTLVPLGTGQTNPQHLGVFRMDARRMELGLRDAQHRQRAPKGQGDLGLLLLPLHKLIDFRCVVDDSLLSDMGSSET